MYRCIGFIVAFVISMANVAYANQKACNFFQKLFGMCSISVKSGESTSPSVVQSPNGKKYIMRKKSPPIQTLTSIKNTNTGGDLFSQLANLNQDIVLLDPAQAKKPPVKKPPKLIKVIRTPPQKKLKKVLR